MLPNGFSCNNTVEGAVLTLWSTLRNEYTEHRSIGWCKVIATKLYNLLKQLCECRFHALGLQESKLFCLCTDSSHSLVIFKFYQPSLVSPKHRHPLWVTAEQLHTATEALHFSASLFYVLSLSVGHIRAALLLSASGSCLEKGEHHYIIRPF